MVGSVRVGATANRSFNEDDFAAKLPHGFQTILLAL
jgi:hypothetical protein